MDTTQPAIVNPLAKLSIAHQALAEAKGIDEVKAIRDMAEAARIYAKQSQMSMEAQNYAAEIRLRADRRLGEVITDMEKNDGGRPEKTTDSLSVVSAKPPKLADLGISHKQSSRTQQIAAIPADVFEQHIEETKASGEELTTASLLRIKQTGNMAVHFTSETPEHYTPQEIIDAVIECLGAIDLDPCSNSKTKPNVPATHYFTMEDDGLNHPWIGRVYMNPPYGKDIDDWVAKLCQEHAEGGVTEAVTLVPARTDTRWWLRLRDYPVCLIEGRLKFGGLENSAPFPSAAFYLGCNIDRFYYSFCDLGDIWQVIEPGMFGE